MWLKIVLEQHLLPGSNVKIRFNAPSPGFAFQERGCTTSRREFLWKNFYSARIKFSPRMLSRFYFPAGFSPGSWRRVFFLGGIPASTDFSAGFLPRYAAGIFPRKDPAGKTGHLCGIPVSAGNLGGIPARSRYLFYKGSLWSKGYHYCDRLLPCLTCKSLTCHGTTNLRLICIKRKQYLVKKMSLSSIFFNFPFSVTSSLLILQKIAKVCNIAINVYNLL